MHCISQNSDGVLGTLPKTANPPITLPPRALFFENVQFEAKSCHTTSQDVSKSLIFQLPPSQVRMPRRFRSHHRWELQNYCWTSNQSSSSLVSYLYPNQDTQPLLRQPDYWCTDCSPAQEANCHQTGRTQRHTGLLHNPAILAMKRHCISCTNNQQCDSLSIAIMDLCSFFQTNVTYVNVLPTMRISSSWLSNDPYGEILTQPPITLVVSSNWEFISSMLTVPPPSPSVKQLTPISFQNKNQRKTGSSRKYYQSQQIQR